MKTRLTGWLTTIFLVCIQCCIVFGQSNQPTGQPQTPSFRRDVMPVFFRAGCNSGTCHGSARGKDGFMLSLFGYDPAGDYRRTVEEMPGRRINVSVPQESLLLLKATASVPHTGGKLFDRDSRLYQTLLEWIEAGAPDDSGAVPEVIGVTLSKTSLVFEEPNGKSALQITANYSDGTTRDVTSLSRFFSNNPSVAQIDAQGLVTGQGFGDTNVFGRYSRFTVGAEVIVLPPAQGFVWSEPPENNFIDRLVFERLQKLRIAPSELCDDETFLRRVTLDLVGRPPTPQEYDAFMTDESPNKRSSKIDALIATDDFADYQAAMWAEQLRVIGGNYSTGATVIKAADRFANWIRDQLRKDRPLNEFVSEMTAASGPNIANGPVNLYTMLVHKPQVDPKMLAADFSQVFLGVQIQCAECHNHPFDRWTMDDYYGFVSFFTGVRRKPGVEAREKRIFWDVKSNPATNPVDGQPRPAKTLGAIDPVGVQGDPRGELAKWLASPENDIFAKNMANRIWAHFLGRGVVEPVDDMRVSNPPTNAPLLDGLSQRLVDVRFDLRSFVRDICNSRVYQLATSPTASNAKDTRQFSHAKLRRLRADVLLDSIVAVTGVPRSLPGWPAGTKAVNYYPRVSGDTEGPHPGDPFFETFGRSSRGTVCACETKRDPTLSQTMHLVVGDTIRDRLSSPGFFKALLDSQVEPEQIIESLFVRALSRKPTAEERVDLMAFVSGNEKSQEVYEDIFWALMNSTEFLFNH
ncbi:MAG: DUF1549 and DUF1553 domain-containing protein [Planctomycetaceae bacterium]|jgi:hypothetical protein|nr:DUF1549 and DUF1553 domain-containing protein [Planctomycetaceae bacterium]